jgi:primosomal protein N' (replication factor Y)
VLTPEIFDLARAVADRYAGTLADVLRLAIPPRHATAEREVAAEREAPAAGTAPAPAPAEPTPAPPDPGSWSRYPAGAAFLAGLAEGRRVRAAWSALPGPEWPAEIAVAAATTAATGRGVVIVVPDARDLDRVDAALTETGLDHVCLAADLGPPSATGAGWLRAAACPRGGGHPGCDVRPGRRARPGGAWDDGDDLHAAARAVPERPRGARPARPPDRRAALIGGFARTAELISWSRAGGPGRFGSAEALRQVAPRVRAAPDEAELARDAAAMTARLPSLALRTAREALTGGARGGLAPGPVLVQVPRRGYLAAVACARCRAQARCATCAGPLEIRLTQHARLPVVRR